MSGKDFRVDDYLAHIEEAIAWIGQFTADMEEEDFEANIQCQHAVIRNIEVIGEAAHNIIVRHPEFARLHAEVFWQDIYRMRNRLSHGYFSINLHSVWLTVTEDIPKLQQQIKRIRASLQ